MTDEELLSRLLTVRDAIDDGEACTFDALSGMCVKQGLTRDDVALALRIMRALDVVKAHRFEGDTFYSLNK